MAEAEIFYQAIGELYASLVVTSSGTKVLATGENQYRAIVPEKIEKKYQKIQGGQLFWRVYPQFQDQHLAFVIVSVSEQLKSEPGRFFIQGDWVNLAQIEIWRNAEAGKVNAKNWRPRLLPISWQDAPPADGSFWQLQAQLVNGTLEVTNAAGPFPHPPRLEALPQFKPYNHNKPQQKQQGWQTGAKSKPSLGTEIINWEELIPVSGKLELTIKINSLPQANKANGVCHFKVECDGRMVQIALKPKQWTKLETANATYAEWIAAISGKMGAVTSDGFVLEDANVQVFERKSKATTQTEQVLVDLGDRPSDAEQAQTTGFSAIQTKPETLKAQTQSGDAERKSIASPEEKLASKAKSSTSSSEPQPKKIGKFKVQIR
jgi:hypothetical protein